MEVFCFYCLLTLWQGCCSLHLSPALCSPLHVSLRHGSFLSHISNSSHHRPLGDQKSSNRVRNWCSINCVTKTKSITSSKSIDRWLTQLGITKCAQQKHTVKPHLPTHVLKTINLPDWPSLYLCCAFTDLYYMPWHDSPARYKLIIYKRPIKLASRGPHPAREQPQSVQAYIYLMYYKICKHNI